MSDRGAHLHVRAEPRTRPLSELPAGVDPNWCPPGARQSIADSVAELAYVDRMLADLTADRSGGGDAR